MELASKSGFNSWHPWMWTTRRLPALWTVAGEPCRELASCCERGRYLFRVPRSWTMCKACRLIGRSTTCSATCIAASVGNPNPLQYLPWARWAAGLSAEGSVECAGSWHIPPSRTRCAVPASIMAVQASFEPPTTHAKDTPSALAVDMALVQSSMKPWSTTVGMQIRTVFSPCTLHQCCQLDLMYNKHMAASSQHVL